MLHVYNRTLSRCIVVPFEKKLGFRSTKQLVAHSRIGEKMDGASKAIPYFVSLGELYEKYGASEATKALPKMKELLPSCVQRVCTAYADLLWFAKKVVVSLIVPFSCLFE